MLRKIFKLGGALTDAAETTGQGAGDSPAAPEPVTPRMALRLDRQDSDLLDDVVVHEPTMFRAEMMDDRTLWMACYFANGEHVTFYARVAPGRKKRLWFIATETPGEWADIDQERRNA